MVPATLDRIDDVDAVLGSVACWCAYYRQSAREYGRVRADEVGNVIRQRRALMHERLKEDIAPGMLAFVDGAPVGGCGLGCRSEFTRLQRSRSIAPVDELPVWSVVCFLVKVGFRRRGVATALLSGAVAYTTGRGAPAIEGYPVDPADSRIDSASAYVGATSMFEAAGFEQRSRHRRSKRRPEPMGPTT